MSELFDHPRIDQLRELLVQTFTPEGVEIWLRFADKQGWSFEEAMTRADQLASGAFT